MCYLISITEMTLLPLFSILYDYPFLRMVIGTCHCSSIQPGWLISSDAVVLHTMALLGRSTAGLVCAPLFSFRQTWSSGNRYITIEYTHTNTTKNMSFLAPAFFVPYFVTIPHSFNLHLDLQSRTWLLHFPKFSDEDFSGRNSTNYS